MNDKKKGTREVGKESEAEQKEYIAETEGEQADKRVLKWQDGTLW